MRPQKIILRSDWRETNVFVERFDKKQNPLKECKQLMDSKESH